MSAFLTGMSNSRDALEEHDRDQVYSVSVMSQFVNSLTGGITTNDLTAFKKYIESGDSGIEAYVSDIAYGYDTALNIYSADTSAAGGCTGHGAAHAIPAGSDADARSGADASAHAKATGSPRTSAASAPPGARSRNRPR